MDTPPLAGIFVLLVEDETPPATSLAPFLEHAGALVRSFPPAVAPGLVAHVRPDAVLAALAPDERSLARQHGADVTLRKPLEPRLVLDAVEGLLARS